MENASKALVIAGSVLVAVLMLVIAVALHNRYKEAAQNIEGTQEAQEIGDFNSEFEKYIGRTDITVQEVLTVKNLITELSKKGFYVQAYLGDENLNNLSTDDATYLKNNANKKYEFVEIKYNNGRVNYIKFK